MKYQVLLVEDDHNLANGVRDYLQDYGMVVTYVSDGRSGYQQAKNKKFDLVILDVKLPRMEGFKILRKLRDENIQVPILMLTKESTIPDILKGLDGGADDYLAKPFNTQELVARVLRLIKRPPTVREDTLCFEDITIDLDNTSAKVGNQPLKLSKKEYTLLVFMVRNKGIILSRDRLLRDVWISKQAIRKNTVDKLISNLRRKLFEVESTAVIKTVHGFGYVLKRQ